MKTYKYLMMCIMAASVAMYGCSSDDEPNKEEQKRENNENVTPAKARMQLTDEQDAISLQKQKLRSSSSKVCMTNTESMRTY